MRPGRIKIGGRLLDTLARWLGNAIVALVSILLLLPVALTIVSSFSNDKFYAFPPKTWGLRQYAMAVADPIWGASAVTSLKVSIPAVVFILLITVPAVFAMLRSRLPGRHLLNFAALATLLLPVSGYAVAIYGVFAQLGLINTYVGVVLAMSITAFPLVMATVASAMNRIPVELEYAAMLAGASRGGAWKDVTLKILMPAIVGGGVLALITVFDEVVLINFLGGPGLVTLPKAIFDSVLYSVDPVITAIATLLMIITGLIMAIGFKIQRRG